MSRQLNPNIFGDAPSTPSQPVTPAHSPEMRDPATQTSYAAQPVTSRETSPVQVSAPSYATQQNAEPTRRLTAEASVQRNAGIPGAMGSRLNEPQRHMDSIEAQVFSAQIEGLKEKIHHLSTALESLKLSNSEDQQVQNFKVERLNGRVQNFETVLKQNVIDTHERLAQLMSKINGNKVNEAKIEQMLDRHGQLVQGFEIKMQKMQRIISEQELQIINYKSELKEAREELLKIKRMR